MKEYVVGFLFSENLCEVALIRKTHPDWQAGKLNGIGGEIDVAGEESPFDAMRREFKEETGVDITDWNRFAILHDERGWNVRFYWAIGDPYQCRPVTEEEPEVCHVESLPENVIPNLRWLIPMALAMQDERCDGFTIKEWRNYTRANSPPES